jgi:prefoldin subunit 5
MLDLENGNYLECTADHKIYTIDGNQIEIQNAQQQHSQQIQQADQQHQQTLQQADQQHQQQLAQAQEQQAAQPQPPQGQ